MEVNYKRSFNSYWSRKQCGYKLNSTLNEGWLATDISGHFWKVLEFHCSSWKSTFLSPAEIYQNIYQKGIFLNPKKWRAFLWIVFVVLFHKILNDFYSQGPQISLALKIALSRRKWQQDRITLSYIVSYYMQNVVIFSNWWLNYLVCLDFLYTIWLPHKELWVIIKGKPLLKLLKSDIRLALVFIG